MANNYVRRKNNKLEELKLVDHPSGLLPWELEFCRQYASGVHFIDSYKKTCALHDIVRDNEHSMRMKAVSMLKKPIIKKYLGKLQDKMVELGVAPAYEVQSFLTDVVRNGRDELEKEDQDAEKIRLALMAAKSLAELGGWNAPTKLNVDHTGGVMVVPMAENVDDWSKMAIESQRKLMDDAIDI